ncbi:MAG: C4-dicarboxylate ABC transporter permease, partial [Pseudorhodoplanes sp.]
MALLALLGSGIWVALSLLGVAVIGILVFADAPVDLVMPSSVWGAVSSWTLTALPLFIWMGEIL